MTVGNPKTLIYVVIPSVEFFWESSQIFSVENREDCVERIKFVFQSLYDNSRDIYIVVKLKEGGRDLDLHLYSFFFFLLLF